MRPAAVLFVIGAVVGIQCGCRTPVPPPTSPVANLYPTLNPSAILEQCRPVRLAQIELSAGLAHLGLLGPLRTHGMAAAELPLVLRGLERHGYAELDARRTVCPVRWVVLRGEDTDGGTRLVIEAGLQEPPVTASQWAIDVKRPPATVETRAEAYGRSSRVETWHGTSERAAVEVRRVTPRGALPYWELSYRAGVRMPAGADS